MSFSIKCLEDFYRYIKGMINAIPLSSLITLINQGYLKPDITCKISFNVKLSDGTIIENIGFPLNLNEEEGYRDALRLVRIMIKRYEKLTPYERRILHTLAKSLGILLPGNIRSRNSLVRLKSQESLVLEINEVPV